MKPPSPLRALKWSISIVLALSLLSVLLIALFGWNWMRAPIERYALEKTGRKLEIKGNLTIRPGWGIAHLRADSVTYANPDWAQEKNMLSAQGVEISLDLTQLLHRKISFPEVLFDHASVFLEQSPDGRKSWLLDRMQQDENARIEFGRIVLDNGSLGYDDSAQKTHIRSQLSTQTTSGKGAHDLAFFLQGQFKGVTLKAKGNGGPILSLRDTSKPYPISIDANLGTTRVRANGTVSGILALTALDLNMAVSGDSLDRLYPLLGIAFPTTRDYVTAGHLIHKGNTWRYDKFIGRMGRSDIAGYVEVMTGAKRPVLTADLRSQILALDDLAPLIGSRPDSVARAVSSPMGRVLPDIPFNAKRWDSVDADVLLKAQTISQTKAWAVENLQVHMVLQDQKLALDPLTFDFAGGQISASIALNGRTSPIQTQGKLYARKLLLSKIIPAVDFTPITLGELNGDVDLAGYGNSVANMLATSTGKVGFIVSDGQISRLMMEKAGLHLLEIFQLSLTGDKPVKLRCVVADFDVKKGNMRANALVLDTEVTTLLGSGNINLALEQFDLVFNPRTKTTSPIALRSPIYVRGSFAKPTASIDKQRVALRAAGAVALAFVNPLLALIPLVDAGPGKDSDCGQLVRDAKTLKYATPQNIQPEK